MITNIHRTVWEDRHMTVPDVFRAGVLAAQIGDLYAFTDGWLGNRRLSEHTREAYRRDVAVWLDWCQARQLDPLRATRSGERTGREWHVTIPPP
jgi:Phage integrase, N-terminal SAM-like domain